MSIFGGPSEEEKERIKRRAEEAQREYEASYGAVEEEPGVEEGDWMDYLIANPATIVKQGGKMAVKEVGKGVTRAGTSGVINKVKEKGAPPTLKYDKIEANRKAARAKAEAEAPVIRRDELKTPDELRRAANRERLEKTNPNDTLKYSEGGKKIERIPKEKPAEPKEGMTTEEFWAKYFRGNK